MPLLDINGSDIVPPDINGLAPTRNPYTPGRYKPTMPTPPVAFIGPPMGIPGPGQPITTPGSYFTPPYLGPPETTPGGEPSKRFHPADRQQILPFDHNAPHHHRMSIWRQTGNSHRRTHWG